jgi:hypothetical protein
VAILRSIDMFDTVELVQGLSDNPRRKLYPQIKDEMLACDLYAAGGGRIEVGYDAYVIIAKQIGLLWPASLLMRFPPVAALGRKVYRRIAESRRRAEISNLQEEPLHSPASALVHRVGLVLVACQLGISSTMLFYSLRDVYLPPTARWLAPVSWLVSGIGWRAPSWPFDLYPTFTPITPPEFEIWEAQWVTADGRELRISPRAYYGLYANSNLTWNVLVSAAHDPNPERSLTRSIDLVRALWRTESVDVRESVTAVKIYRARYLLKPSGDVPGTLLEESLIHTFPVEVVSKASGEAGLEHNPLKFQTQ